MGASDLSAVDRFLAHARTIAIQRPANADHHLYEQIKQQLGRVGASPEEYTRAVQEIAKACGV